MARRRLTPLPRSDDAPLTRLNPAAPAPPPAPIAAQARAASREAALEDIAAETARARAEGRLLLDLPLDAVDADLLARDRILAAEPDEEMAALTQSIRAHGQRTPIEVTPPKDGRHGLVSGLRRLTALARLHAETGEDRFATVRALIRQPADAAAAYVAMVEENEIRQGLSQYERARVAARAVERGVFPTEKAALLALYATASRPKRSRIRAFLKLYHALDDVLRFPAAIPERLGLKLVERLEEGAAGGIRLRLMEARPADAAAELALLTRLASSSPKALPAGPGPYDLDRGKRLTARQTLKEGPRGGTLSVKLKGRAVDSGLARALQEFLADWEAGRR